MKRGWVIWLLAATWLAIAPLGNAAEVDVQSLLKSINAVGAKGEGHKAAMAAWKTLTQADAERIPEILAGVDDDNKLAVNWIRAAVDAIAQKQLDAGGKLPQVALEKFLSEADHSPRARRAAFELIVAVDADARQRLIPTLLNDPDMELRRDAVADALAKAETLLKGEDKATAAKAFREVLSAARDLDQINAAAKPLRDLGETVDLPTHFGFVMTWKLIGPFDNVADKGWDQVFGPETNPDPAAEYPGKDGTVKWIDHTTKDEYGTVDLNEVMGKFKGAVAYAYAEFDSADAREVELRLGCINANKVWLNGELLTANHVYHANTFIDQYAGRGRLKAGKNVILLKIAQNEQTESWAQRWQFQLRVCDRYGTAVTSAASSLR